MLSKPMPVPPSFRHLLGPSFILLSLGLGSGEIILWPYLTANFGMGIIWGAILGITLQFFINMEIERYTLAKGESIFMGFARKFKFAPLWFLFSTFAGFAWPGIIAASAALLAKASGLGNPSLLGIFLLVLIGLILTIGPVLYKTVEKFSMLLIGIGVPAIFALTLYLVNLRDWADLVGGLANIGNLPAGLPIASFLAAFAFSGAGGNLNLAQSFYVKEKGYGMGKYGGRITSILSGKVEDVRLAGVKFAATRENLQRFTKWWELINWEHLLVFWLGGILAICLLALLAYATVFGKATPQAGIEFLFLEASEISKTTLPLLGTFFLVVAGLFLFATQTTVLDATSRIMAENLLIAKSSHWKTRVLPRIYYSFLWSQIAFGILIFLFGVREPLFLLTLSAIINGIAMLVHMAATLALNLTSLEGGLSPSLPRILTLLAGIAFFAYFSIRLVIG